MSKARDLADGKFDTDTLVVDAANNRVGIGTSSPAGRLSLTAPTGNGTLDFITGSITSDSLRIQSGGSVTNWLEYRGYLGHAWIVDTTEAMRIDSSGKLSLTASDQGIQIGADIAAYTIKRDGSGLLNFRATQTNFNGYIFDTVDGERMRITSSGRVGLRNTDPQRDLHIGAADNTNHDGIIVLNNGGATGYRAGIEWRYESNTTPRARISVNASNQILEFDTAGTERMRIDSDGHVNFNTTSTTNYAQSSGTGNFTFRNDDGTTGGSIIVATNADRGWANCYMNRFAYASGDDTRIIAFHINGGGTGYIRCNDAGTQITYNATSDRRLKENIQDLTNGIETIKQLRPRTFEWITNEDKTFPAQGFIADEVDNIIPELVNGEANAVDEDGNPAYQNMDYSKIVPLLTAALQEAIAKIETLEAKVTALETP